MFREVSGGERDGRAERQSGKYPANACNDSMIFVPILFLNAHLIIGRESPCLPKAIRNLFVIKSLREYHEIDKVGLRSHGA